MVCPSTLNWLSYSSDISSPTKWQTPSPIVGFIPLPRNDCLLLREYVSIQPLTSNGRLWFRNASNNLLPRNWLTVVMQLPLTIRYLGNDVSLSSELNCHNTLQIIIIILFVLVLFSFFGGIYLLGADFVYIKFVGHNLKVSFRRHIYICWQIIFHTWCVDTCSGFISIPNSTNLAPMSN
jgi:hypothetical protein